MASASTLAGKSLASGLRHSAPSRRSRSPAVSASYTAQPVFERGRGDRGNSARTAQHWGTTAPAALGHGTAPQSSQAGPADPNERDSFGQTLLIRAAADGKTAIMQRLLQQGADVNVQDEWGTSSMHLAAAKGHAAAVGLLLQHGADVDARDSRGRTCLAAVSLWGAYTMMENLAILSFPFPHSAQGAYECAAALVAAGADVNTQDDMGLTPLATLVQSSMDEHAAATARLLLGAGADGCPALEMALHYENLAALEVLVSSGVDATGLLTAKLEFTRTRRLAADEALLLLRAGASIEALPFHLKQFAIQLAMRDRADRA